MARGNIFVRAWRYLRTALGMKFDEAADPRVQLEQAIQEAQDQHRRLKEQAATVIANQKQTEAKLDRSMDELDKLTGNAQQALLMAEEARGRRRRRQGRRVRARGRDHRHQAHRGRGARSRTSRRLHLDAVKASDQAKNAVAQNSATLQKKLSERQQLLSQLDQAKMAETMTEAMASLSETVGSGHPDLRRGPRQDRGAPREGPGAGRARRLDRRGPHARGRAGLPQRRRPAPAVRAALQAGHRRGAGACREAEGREHGRPSRAGEPATSEG